jgi:ATP-dependent DNA helicase RecQ
MNSIHQLLQQYWGFKSFRPLQEEIINSVLQGKDTLALLPTGGGKSICFQVPALTSDGICVVVSPLIALMKDQVESLVSKGIKAVAITSEMHKREIDIALDNCIYGDVKFLYLSPERLQNDIVKIRLQKMKISLLAIDEAHCISQWGYDFRPSYLKIKELRTLLSNVPVLGLTATATPAVVKDIQQQLLFKKECVFTKSFERTNLAYVVLYEEDKLQRLVKIVKNLKGSGIVYVRSRKKTQETASYLKSNKISADFYHAGLEPKQRTQKQNDWMQNKTRIIVCTNAFGMGIDKPDVEFVVHIDLPDSIEAYFQEAGRAGRNEKRAYAILIYNNADALALEDTVKSAFPSLDEIKKTYQALANYYQIPIGGGLDSTSNFDIAAFCDHYNLEAIVVFNSLKFLEREGYIAYTDALFQPSKVKLELNREDLYKFQLSEPVYDVFIKLLLRSYAGMFDNFVKINEFDLAKKARVTKDTIVKKLNYLNANKVIGYIPQTELPQITFTQARADVKNISISKENYSLLKKNALERMEALISYASKSHQCRSRVLLNYFGETDSYRCNQCDVCLDENKKTLHVDEFDIINKQVRELLAMHTLTLQDLVNAITEGNEDKRIQAIRWLLDNGELGYNDNNELCLK